MSEPHTLHIDLVIIGGGIAGLWTLTHARQQGYSAILLEQEALGSGQTIASQGMIHGGIKYALGGTLSGESEAIADMPELWQRCLAGDTDPRSTSPVIDLQQTRVLSHDFYLWSNGLVGRLGSFFASKSLRGRVETLKRKQYPPVLNHPDFKGAVYRLVDCVVDVTSLLENLAALNAGRIFSIDWQQAHWDIATQQLHLNPQLSIAAQRYIFSAGKGNETLLEAWHEQQPSMQLRPLQQVIVKHRLDNAAIYGHCMGSQIQATPRLSISSHACHDGSTAWYLGGDLATEHANTNAETLIELAQQELATLFPWLDFSAAEWACLKVDRAEPRQPQLLKPDNAFVAASKDKPLITAWPTKLTLAPDMAARVLDALRQQDIAPMYPETTDGLEALPTVGIAKAPWEFLFNT